ncbi:hypothetical protein ACQJBY_006421 [Aegilops geniculata]
MSPQWISITCRVQLKKRVYPLDDGRKQRQGESHGDGGGGARRLRVSVRSCRQVPPAGSWRRRVRTGRPNHPNSGVHSRPAQNWRCRGRGPDIAVRFEQQL